MRELGDLLKEFLCNAEKNNKNDPSEFSDGYSCAIKGLISSLIQVREGFGISLEELGLDDIDPDKDLIG